MRLSRSSSIKQVQLPRRRQKIVSQIEQISQHQRQLFSKQSSRCNRYISTAIAPSRSSRALFLTNPAYSHCRPNTTVHLRLSDQTVSPLQVIRTRSMAESSVAPKIQAKVFQSNFLKRGSSIDKAVVKQVLKSKLNMNVCAPSYSYWDHPDNRQTVRMVAGQIPKGLRDVVGVQQMMRMTHIMTGVGFKTANLHHLLHERMVKGKIAKKKQTQDDDTITLRSIKRW